MNDTLRTALVALLSAVAGALLALALTGDGAPSRPAASDSPDLDALRGRVAVLEGRLTASPLRDDPPVATTTADAIDEAAAAEAPRERRSADGRERQAEGLGTKLREAGWSDAEIDSLTELRGQAALQLEQQQYDAMRQRLEENPEDVALWRDRRNVMRDVLGDEKYEQYLEAAGRPVAAEIRHVLAGSAGESAGLRSGDQIRRYGTTRVFGERDLMFALLDGEPGEPVSIEIERDGAIFHVTVPRGPLGISRAARFGMDF